MGLSKTIFRRRKIYPIYVSLVLLVIPGLALIAIHSMDKPKIINSSPTTAATQTEILPGQKLDNPIPAPKGVAEYKLVSLRRDATTLKVYIFTTEQDHTKLAKLNDALLDYYKDSYALGNKQATGQDVEIDQKTKTPKPSNLRIEYFADEQSTQVASSVTDLSKLPVEKRTEVTSHFTAFLLSSRALGTNLFGVRPSTVLIKRYEV